MLSATTQYIVFYNSLLLIVLFTSINFLNKINKYIPNHTKDGRQAILLLAFIIIIIAWRDWSSPLFGDSKVYGLKISQAMSHSRIKLWNDWGFNWITLMWGKLKLSQELFFFFTASAYCIPLYIAARKLTPNYTFLFLLFCATSLSFYAFGVNGIRNGMATSLVILAMTYKDKILILISLLLLGLSLHNSIIIPIGAILITLFYKKTPIYFWIWIVSIFVSLFSGKYFNNLFLKVNFISESASGYLGKGVDLQYIKFSNYGFRWDFLLYSMAPIVFGYYIIQIKKISDDFYTFYLNTYLLCNSIWILVISSNFSNRIAYLSWFMMPILFVYPLVNFTCFKSKNLAISSVLFAYYAFTYFMWVVK
ncbi:MAG TPA: EpsG family protein [Paludibacter sp.]